MTARPTGTPPKDLTVLDDCIFDAQCSADTQVLNTQRMLERWRRVFADGRTDEKDTQDLLYIRRHTLLEDRLNLEVNESLREARKRTNRIVELVNRYRGRLQRGRAVLADGSPMQQAMSR